jgi:hypothetical protein
MKIEINLTKAEITHLKENIECASETCSYFQRILNKCKNKVKKL